jgi:hypothetical protein
LREQPTTTTVAIIGANPVVENALAHLLAGEGYSTTVLKPFTLMEGESLEEEQMPSLLGGANLVVLAPSLSTREVDTFLAYRRGRASKQRTPSTPSAPPPTDTPVVVLCTPMKDSPALLLEEEDKAVTRSVAWPTTRERLVREVEALLLVQQQEARLAAQREEQASAPEKKMEYAE